MARVPLKGGAYTARSLIADAQRCVNLYPEKNPEGAASEYTHYPTPGLKLLGAGPVHSGWRGLYQASNGIVYGVLLDTVYRVTPQGIFLELGVIETAVGIVVMQDNGIECLLVDGSGSGWTWTLSLDIFGEVFSKVVDDSGIFKGGTHLGYIDTFLLANTPKTREFVATLSNEIVFDPLYFADKSGYPDPIAAMLVMHKELWIIGTQTTEIWYDAGEAQFPFLQIQGAFIEHGCVAPYSAATADLNTYWLSADKQGQGMVLRGKGYQVERISTHALEQEIQQYGRLDDAVAFCYQQDGHLFYQITFPQADRTWVWDEATQFWHQRGQSRGNGVVGRHRAQVACAGYGKILLGDYENGNVYYYDLNTYTDHGTEILRLRSFPHIVNEGQRIYYKSFIADMQCGEGVPAGDYNVSLRWSDTRGRTWGTPVQQTMGSGGEFLSSIQWRRLGYARDRVFEISWVADVKTALQGAWLEGPTPETPKVPQPVIA